MAILIKNTGTHIYGGKLETGGGEGCDYYTIH